MHPADIKALIAKKGYTLRQLDEKFGFPTNTCSNVFHVGRPSVEREMSKLLGLPPKKLWPDRYWSDGTRKNPRDRRKNNRKQRPLTRAKKAAQQ